MIITRQIGEAWEVFVDFLLPRLCCGCGDRVHRNKWLVCEPCMNSIPEMRLPICSICGCADAVAKDEMRCKNCPPGRIWFEKARGVFQYTDLPHLLVEKLKYKGRIEYAGLMALDMARLISEDTSAKPDLIIPVPLHKTRQRERGFNQSMLLAREIAAIIGVSVGEKLLIRNKPTPTQTRLKRRERRANVAGAFSCRNQEMVRDRHILIIDDVYTTGSTLNECAKILKEAGAATVNCVAYTRATLE